MKHQEVVVLDSIKGKYPQVNSKTRIVETKEYKVTFIEAEISPERVAIKKQSYLKKLGMALIGKDPEFVPRPIPVREKHRILYLEPVFYAAPMEQRKILLHCGYDPSMDILFVHKHCDIDIKLELLR